MLPDVKRSATPNAFRDSADEAPRTVNDILIHMAMFRDHVAVGAVLTTGAVVGAYSYMPIEDPVPLVVLFVATVVASFLPDLDSDSGLPFYIIFGTFTLACSGLALYYLLQTGTHDWRLLAGVPLGILAFTWYVFGTIFKRLTDHRGMMHSLPAMAIAGLGTFIIARYLALPLVESCFFAGSVAIGYLSHLILDELHSGVNLEGVPFLPKHSSVGTATKLLGHSTFTNIAYYGALLGLVYVAQHSLT
jgi:membrane-bound metal-dependent hydrolase YbcI (DUF457 family)